MENLRRKKSLRTLAVLAAVLFAFCFIFREPALAWLGAALVLLPFVSVGAASAAARAWLKFAELLGRLNTALLLGLVYFLILTPLALLFRLVTGGSGSPRFDPAARTYFRERSRTFGPADLEKPW